jgi:hypothetical protein
VGDVGIDLLKPRYVPSLIVAEDTAYWEALYDDGSVLCEAEGATYGQIDRGRLQSFRIIHNGTIVFEVFPKNGTTGHQLVYRRRTAISAGVGRDVEFIVGFVPNSFFVIDIQNGQYHEDPNILQTLTPMPGEPPNLLTDYLDVTRA